jgi:hypothetical protein
VAWNISYTQRSAALYFSRALCKRLINSGLRNMAWNIIYTPRCDGLRARELAGLRTTPG